MKIAIMQPYIFPYIGYFQLINAVDFFGIGDDVQYIKGGWINRNRILAQKQPYMFSFSVKKDSFHKKIKERYFSNNFKLEKDKLLRVIEMHYKKAPNYNNTIVIVQSIFESDERNVSIFAKNQLKIICNYLDIKTEFVESEFWEISLDNSLSVEDRAVKKLKKLKSLGVNHFINPIGGKELYNKAFFSKHDFELSFLESKSDSYTQFGNDFHSNLSILDVLMFNDKDTIKKMLNQYILL